MTIRNFLFVMCDQLRADHLGCYGHPHLATRNIDALAARGVRFDRAFVTSGVCGPSRMSFYTGRTMTSHGATWNRVPLSIDEVTLGEYLRWNGRSLALVGKTHMTPDTAGMRRLGIDAASALGRSLVAGSFVEVERYDGHQEPGDESGYPAFLRRHGYAGDRPWNDYVVSVTDGAGNAHSGWKMRNARWPSRVAEPHSETAWTTDVAIRWIEAQRDTPWALHLSYVKPHWPYVAPRPYQAMYGLDRCLPLVRSDAELDDPHPVLAAYRTQDECVNFMRREVSDTVRPVYQGLVAQVDDHLGRVWETLGRLGRWNDTLVVFTSDHGDYLGDHWLGEKEQFHDTAQRVPLIVFDPTPAADATRGTADAHFVSAIDIVPTALEALGLPPYAHRVEGTSLLPLTQGAPVPTWRDCVVSELDYGYRAARRVLGRKPGECRAWMLRTARWKYVHWQGFRPQLFDLEADPAELVDLGRDPACAGVRDQLHGRLADWHGSLKQRVTVSDEDVERGTDRHREAGIFFGEW